ncbi:MAG: hypothetical protein IKI59_09920, partial [Clostridia bacterium]|nr:hypothetical protein [Clostridia bacterium]
LSANRRGGKGVRERRVYGADKIKERVRERSSFLSWERKEEPRKESRLLINEEVCFRESHCFLFIKEKEHQNPFPYERTRYGLVPAV